jgi:Ca2+-binding RTX toxin-like protein
VFTTVSYNLGVNEVEVLSTVTNADTTAIDLIGNFATQTVVGNYGNNILNGGSGGSDRLIGLRGTDIYAVGSQSIVIVENADEGADTLVAFADYQIRNGVSIEVFAAQNRSGTAALTLRGNDVAQTVVGNAGANVIDGRGGADLLIGDAGADVFAFTAVLGAGNIDAIQDFASGVDKIGLASDVFAGVSGGVAAGSFVLGTVAADGDDRILYDQATGRLFYDADANGAGAAVQFAQLNAGTALSASDFLVVAPVADIA